MNSNQHGLSAPQSFPPSAGQDNLFNGLDPSSSKQLAAINATANARRAHAHALQMAGGSSANALGVMPSRPPDQSFPSNINQQSFPAPNMSAPMQQGMATPAMHNNLMIQRQQVQAIQKMRKQSFFQGLHRITTQAGSPLPSAIVGFETRFDPSQPSRWADLEPTSEPGGVKLAGRDVDLYKLWGLIYTMGGAGKVQQQGAWSSLLAPFGLPEQLPHPQENGNTSTAIALAHLYMRIFNAFDDQYLKGPQFKAQLPSAGSASSSTQSPPGSSGNPVQTQAQTTLTADSTNLPNTPFTSGSVDPEVDADARKRKLDENEELHGKRRKTIDQESSEAPHVSSDSVPPSQMAPPASSSTRAKARRKIEYVPLVREIDTFGGRDINHITNELLRLSRGQQLRDINDWGKVYVDALTMSLRSRISTELSYGLTTLIILSTMRSTTPDSGFMIGNCEELLSEVLDLLEELSFPDDIDSGIRPESTEVITNRQLINLAYEGIASPFAAEEKVQGEYDPSQPGPTQRRADIIRLILNILRNLSAVTDNQAFMAQHPMTIDLLLRLTQLQIREGKSPQPASDALSLPDLILVRKDVLNILVNLAGTISLSPPPSSDSTSPDQATPSRRAELVHNLVASYLIDPFEAVSPFTWAVQCGNNLVTSIRVPLLPDAALEVFTRVSQPDSNRKVFSSSIPQAQIWALFEALVHRLPISEHDFKLIMRDEWISYLTKLVLGLYSLAFIMPPELKRRVKEDRSLGFAKVMMRVVKRTMSGGPSMAEIRTIFGFCARRAVETMKIIDDGANSFDSSQPSVPTLSFGVGYGEVGDKKIEKGSGLLGGHGDDLLVSVMLQKELDEVMFSELESLARVEAVY